jgi:hypothetical protein
MNIAWTARVLPVFLLLALGVSACTGAAASPEGTPATPPAAEVVVHAALLASAAADDPKSITVYQTPTCGCCGGWVDHIREAGFDVTVEMHDNLAPIRREMGVPPAMTTCHLGVVAGFVVEGHVPADALKRFLQERPAVMGLAVPGMPIGSPGMEVPGMGVDPYDVVTFDRSGQVAVFESRR